MPLYEYECENCGNHIEVLHGVDEKGPERCAKCGGKLKRLIGAPGLIFKGSGFYVNDYGRNSVAGGKPTGKGRRVTESHDRSKEPDSADKGEPASKPAPDTGAHAASSGH